MVTVFRRAGVCLLEDKSQSRRTPPLGTMAVVAAYHSMSRVPRHTTLRHGEMGTPSKDFQPTGSSAQNAA